MELQQMLSIPDISKCKKLLCVQPHPDDNEIGAGATIAKLVESGCEVHYLTVTDGSLGSSDPLIEPAQLVQTRLQEQVCAAKMLGVTGVEALNFRDYMPNTVSEIAMLIAEAIRRIKPQIVMTVDPWLPYEAHPDHPKTGLATVEACLFSGLPRYPATDSAAVYPVWQVEGIAFYNTAYPNTYIDVSEYMEAKMSAMAAHGSQFNQDMLNMYSDFFYAQATRLAEGKGFKLAEAFKVLSPIHLHCYVDAIHT